MSTHEPERDYLWDREGEPDPLVQRLEGLLRDFGHDGRALPPLRRPRRRWPLWTAAAVAAAAGIVFTVLATTPEPQLQPGAAPRTFAAGKEPVVVPLGELAAITLRPGGELRFEHWRDDQALFRLERGALTARVAPPPAVAPDFFCIDTALGRVTDKGCRYELTVAGDGTNAIEVTEGAVTFDFDGRVVFVPAGAATKVTAKGPSTPLFTDCSAELRRAVGLFDRATMAGESGMREKGVYAVVQAVREPRDTLVLWHLLRDPDPLLREQAAAALLDLAGPPPDDPIVLDPPTWDPAVWLAWLRLGAWRPAK